MNETTYTIHWTDTAPVFHDGWNASAWQHAETLAVRQFHPQSSAHRPTTEVKVLYDTEHLYLFFRVKDQYVKACHVQYQDQVCQDSCVELFIQPCLFDYQANAARSVPRYRGYFTLEINCVGTLLMFYIDDWTRTPDGFARYTPVEQELAESIVIYHTLSGTIEQELVTPLEWHIGYNLPFALLEHFVGALDIRAGHPWRGNFFKCGDHTSHPHWASWSPIGQRLNFHDPRYFGSLRFGN